MKVNIIKKTISTNIIFSELFKSFKTHHGLSLQKLKKEKITYSVKQLEAILNKIKISRSAPTNLYALEETTPITFIISLKHLIKLETLKTTYSEFISFNRDSIKLKKQFNKLDDFERTRNLYRDICKLFPKSPILKQVRNKYLQLLTKTLLKDHSNFFEIKHEKTIFFFTANSLSLKKLDDQSLEELETIKDIIAPHQDLLPDIFNTIMKKHLKKYLRQNFPNNIEIIDETLHLKENKTTSIEKLQLIRNTIFPHENLFPDIDKQTLQEINKQKRLKFYETLQTSYPNIFSLNNGRLILEPSKLSDLPILKDALKMIEREMTVTTPILQKTIQKRINHLSLRESNQKELLAKLEGLKKLSSATYNVNKFLGSMFTHPILKEINTYLKSSLISTPSLEKLIYINTVLKTNCSKDEKLEKLKSLHNPTKYIDEISHNSLIRFRRNRKDISELRTAYQISYVFTFIKKDNEFIRNVNKLKQETSTLIKALAKDLETKEFSMTIDHVSDFLTEIKATTGKIPYQLQHDLLEYQIEKVIRNIEYLEKSDLNSFFSKMKKSDQNFYKHELVKLDEAYTPKPKIDLSTKDPKSRTLAVRNIELKEPPGMKSIYQKMIAYERLITTNIEEVKSHITSENIENIENIQLTLNLASSLKDSLHEEHQKHGEEIEQIINQLLQTYPSKRELPTLQLTSHNAPFSTVRETAV